MNKSEKTIFRHFILTKRLEDAIIRIYGKITKKEIPPKEDIQEFFIALKNRILRYYIVALIFAILPTGITIWLLSNQNQILSNQTEFFKLQYADTKLKEYTAVIHEINNPPSEREFAARKLLNYVKEGKVAETQRSVNFIRAKLNEIDLRGLDLSNINFREALLTSSNLSGEKIANCDFGKATLNTTDITNTTFLKCNFQEAYFGTFLNPKTRKEGLRLRSPNYNMNTLQGAEKFTNCNFIECNLTDWIINFCDFRGANFTDCHWDIKKMKPEKVYAAIFIETEGLSEEILNALSENKAITNKKELIFHIEEAKSYKQKVLAENDLSSIAEGIELAIEFYENILEKLK